MNIHICLTEERCQQVNETSKLNKEINGWISKLIKIDTFNDIDLDRSVIVWINCVIQPQHMSRHTKKGALCFFFCLTLPQEP